MKVLCINHIGSRGCLQPSGIYEVEIVTGRGYWCVLKGIKGSWSSERFKVLEEPATDTTRP